jgi:hypothetical protein
MPTESSWRFLCRLPNRGRFAVRFAQECATHGIRTFPLLTDPNPPDHLAGILPAGRRQARRFLDAHREQCIGILLVVNRLGETATGEWIRFLGKYGVAVLVFALESTPSDDTWKPDGRNVLLCRTSEREMADKAIEECRNAGIDHIGAIKITVTVHSPCVKPS